MDNRRGVPSAVTQAVRELEGEFYLRDEVAATLNVSPSTLKAWGDQHPHLAPHGYAVIGRKKVYLYTLEDVELLRQHLEAKYPIRANGLKTRRRGRPKLWSNDELADRERRRRRANYCLKRAELYRERGEERRAIKMIVEGEALHADLLTEYEDRFAWATSPRRHE